MKYRISKFSKILPVLCLASNLATEDGMAEESQARNVLLIIADDLNDSVHGMGGHPQAYTPNLDRLASMGVRFNNAHSNAPMCAPSRASLLSGLLPTTTGLYNGKKKFRTLPKLKNAVLLPSYFKNNGYQIYCGGKIFHGMDKDNTVFGASDKNYQDGGHIGPNSSYGPYPWDGKTMLWGRPSNSCSNPNIPVNDRKAWSYGFGKLSKLPPGMSNWVYSDNGFIGDDDQVGGVFRYKNKTDRSIMPDEQAANWVCMLLKGKSAHCIDMEGKKQMTAPIVEKKPFFISVGFVKTHFALYSPDEFYENVLNANRITEEEIKLPWVKDGKVQFDDLNDIPSDLRKYGSGDRRYKQLINASVHYKGGIEKLLKDVTLAYLAAVNEIDSQVGKILDALEKKGQLKNTVIIFTSDHGYNHGDKEHFFKYTLWEKSTRVPLIVVDPSPEYDKTRGKECSKPVSLVDLYPTLTDLCNLPEKKGLDGTSLKPFIKDVNADWNGPSVALSAVQVGINKQTKAPQVRLSVRSENFRFTLGTEGGEELYDHRNDPWEWNNLATKPDYLKIKEQLKKELLKISAMNEEVKK